MDYLVLVHLGRGSVFGRSPNLDTAIKIAAQEACRHLKALRPDLLAKVYQTDDDVVWDHLNVYRESDDTILTPLREITISTKTHMEA